MGLFEKKYCDLCGEKIGLLGNRKLEDGNCCKDCAAKLSPWFSDRKNSTVGEIRQQLEYRETNRDRVATFHVTRTYGEVMKLLLDEDNGCFMVTGATDYNRANPDVINFTDVTNVETDISEIKTELRWRNEEGRDEFYRPPQFEYSYDFYLRLYISNPYFDQIYFKLNRNHIVIPNRTVEEILERREKMDRRPPMGGPRPPVPAGPRTAGNAPRPGGPEGPAMEGGWTPPDVPTDIPNVEADPNYAQYRDFIEDLRQYLLQLAGRS